MIQVLMSCYTNLLTGQGISDVIYHTYDSMKMFDTMPKTNLKKGESSRSKACTVFKKFNL